MNFRESSLTEFGIFFLKFEMVLRLRRKLFPTLGELVDFFKEMLF